MDSVGQLLYIIRNLIIFQIGVKSIEEIKTGAYEKLKRQLKGLNDIMDYVLSQPESPFILLNSINVTCHSKRADELISLLSVFQIDHMAIWADDKLYC